VPLGEWNWSSLVVYGPIIYSAFPFYHWIPCYLSELPSGAVSLLCWLRLIQMAVEPVWMAITRCLSTVDGA
jgi:hypothetical protein